MYIVQNITVAAALFSNLGLFFVVKMTNVGVLYLTDLSYNASRVYTLTPTNQFCSFCLSAHVLLLLVFKAGRLLGLSSETEEHFLS